MCGEDNNRVLNECEQYEVTPLIPGEPELPVHYFGIDVFADCMTVKDSA